MSISYAPGTNLVKAAGSDVVTGTNDTYYVTPSGVTSRLAEPGAIGGTTPATSLKVDNVQVDGNTISTTNSNGDLTLAPNGSGMVALADKVLSRPEIKDYAETVSAISTPTSTDTTTLNLENGNVFTITLGNYNATFAFSNPPASGKCGSFTFIMTQYSTAKTVTWPASVKWPNNTAPTISGNSKVYIFAFLTVDGGTTWYGSLVGDTMGG